MRPLIGTSWKMNLTSSEADSWFTAVLPRVVHLADRDLFVLPPFTAIWVARERLQGTTIAWGAQDVHPADGGPHTGDVSAPMLADLGCRYVEIGHSERRRDHGESPELVNAKIAAVLRWGMHPLLCSGEPTPMNTDATVQLLLADLGRCLAGVDPADLSRLVVAYEPWWAIGQGAVPADPEAVGQIQRSIAAWLADRANGQAVPVIYGGSVDVDVAPHLLAQDGVDGLFVGRYALDPVDFARIAATPIGSAEEAR
jgi:triosephosphate isomerase